MDKLDKKRIIIYKTINTLLYFFSENEITFILFDINKAFRAEVIKAFNLKSNKIKECNSLISKNLKSIDEFKYLVKNHIENINLYYEMIKSKEDVNYYILYRSISIIVGNLLCNIKALDIQKNNIGSRGILLLSSLIQKTENLIYFNLAYNNLGDEGIKHFSAQLHKNKSIQTVNLECNSISDGGFCYFIKAVTYYHSNLKIIKLALNHVTKIGLDYLSNSLEDTGFSFIILDLKYNNIVIDENDEKKNLEKNKIYI